MNFKENLMEKIENLLNGNWSVNQFDEEYYYYYLNHVSEEKLSEKELEFFGSIQEQLEWTTQNPDKQSREYGWMDYHDFIHWVRKQQKLFKILK